MYIEDKLYNYSKAYIKLDELLDFLDCTEYHEQYNCVSELITKNIIKPVEKKNSTNGHTPPLYIKYHINKPAYDNSNFINEIKHLECSFRISYYLENLNKYKQQREIILPLSDFLKKHSEKLNNRISKNERAYQIWNYEKALDANNDKYKSIAKSVLELNNLQEKLNYYNTPEPFFYYSPEPNRFNEKTVLIIENKDTWYSIREIMRQSNRSFYILGHIIDGILYGEGKKIARYNALNDFCETELKHKCDFLYYGDLDYEGIGIFQVLKVQSKGFNLQLFSELYIKLIDLNPYQKLGKVIKKQQPIEMTFFLEYFDDNYSNAIRQLLGDGKYIPQEAIGKDILVKIIMAV